MCLSAILQHLYNIFCDSPPPEPPQKKQKLQDFKYLPEPGPQPDVIVMRVNAMGSSDNLRLRSRANSERAQMIESFKQSNQAQSQANKAAAKHSAKEHQRNMQRLDKAASEHIFSENNKVFTFIPLNFVPPISADAAQSTGDNRLTWPAYEEAVRFTDRAIQEATERKDTELRLIVGLWIQTTRQPSPGVTYHDIYPGQGLHSEGGMPKLKPAIEKHLQRRQLVPQVDPKNPGLIIVRIDSKQREEFPVINHKL